MGAKPCQYGFQPLTVFFAHNDEPQSEAAAALYVANDGVGSNAPLLNEKIELGGHAFLDF